MSVHTMRQRTALQRAQQHWQRRHASPLRLVQRTPAEPTWLERINARLWRIHDGRWLWIFLTAAVGVADVGIVAAALGWWRP